MGRKIGDIYSNANLSLNDLEATYNKTMSSIDTKYSKEKNVDYSANFAFYSESDILKEKVDLISELEMEMSLTMLACVEAYLRMDFQNRCLLRKGDNLSKRYREVYHSKDPLYSYSFQDVILAGWKQEMPENENLINQVNEIYKVYRHWLAHGRYWKPKTSLRRFSYMTVFYVLKTFVDAIMPHLMEVDVNDRLFLAV